ncbi:MAG: tRNA threonylcarbamoyladenosine dehydratase [Bacteroidales bacterium]|nr:tRNA threonylcarbamoyladenosine dehydratase [Bacteroidales bacterium]
MAGWTDRTELLVGEDEMRRIRSLRAIVLGVGGVGSWTAEGLVRSGVGHITLVDADRVAASNINRQLPALHSTIGQPKVDVLAQRLRDINPELKVTTRFERYCPETASSYDWNKYDIIIDAIDSLSDKALLLQEASRSEHGRVFSSMGAALKMDPRKLQVAEFWKVKGCPLARALRTKLRRAHATLASPVTCVFSEELIPNAAPKASRQGPSLEGGPPSCPDNDAQPMTYGKVALNGTWPTAVMIQGLLLANVALRPQ